MPLFENSAVPCGDRPKRHGESSYDYWRDSERASMVAIRRQMLESWFTEVPSDDQLDLQQRFPSRIERQHKSALFELFLHHLLLRCGFQVEFHPDIPGVTTHPDFFVTRNGQALFYLEAIAVSNSAEEETENKRIAQGYDTLNALNSPDFYVVRVDGAPDTSPAGAKLRRDLERWLSELDWETIQRACLDEQYERIPSYKWSHEGWEVLFEPIPKSEAARGTQAVQSIGMTMPMHAMQLNLDGEIKEAVITKDRYGNVRLPLVVAVQVIHDFAIKKIDVMDGLLGAEALDLSCNRRPQAARDPSGAWFSPQGPKHTNISAVLAWPTLEPWKFTAVQPIMVHHPCAAHPLPYDTFPITQYIVDQKRRELVERKASSMEDILGLAANWMPED